MKVLNTKSQRIRYEAARCRHNPYSFFPPDGQLLHIMK
jgi:hypothetical protein